MKLLHTLWHDEAGAISAMSWLLLVTILALGTIVGLTTLRDQIVQELGDIALALENLDQSVGTFVDTTPGDDTPGTAPGCIDVSTVAAQPES